jgi:hypothetical protein
METVETVMETNGDGSGGTFPSRQGAGIETSIPQNLSAAAVELRNPSKNFVDCFRVFRPEALYRHRGSVRGPPGGPHHPLAQPGGGRHPLVWCPSGPCPALVRSLSFVLEK